MAILTLTKTQQYMLGAAAALFLGGVYVMKRGIDEEDETKIADIKKENKRNGTLLIVAGVALGGYVIYKTQCGSAATSPDSLVAPTSNEPSNNKDTSSSSTKEDEEFAALKSDMFKD